MFLSQLYEVIMVQPANFMKSLRTYQFNNLFHTYRVNFCFTVDITVSSRAKMVCFATFHPAGEPRLIAILRCIRNLST